MARSGRVKSELGIYHVVLRGQKNLFLADKDYMEFISVLKRYFVSTESQLYAYSLEKNKVHLVFYTPDNMSTVMKPLCTSYARYINREYNKKGKLFYDRYMSEPIENYRELGYAVSFVHTHDKSGFTSINEYSDSGDLCAVEKVKGIADINEILNPQTVYPFSDDYASMSDNEIKVYIISLSGKKASSMSKHEKEELIKTAVKYSNMSKSRLMRIFNLNKVSFAKKEKEEKNTASANKEEAPSRKKKEELSVWLL